MKRSIIAVLLIMVIVFSGATQVTASTGGPSITVDADINEGVYSPNVMGNMFEWASDYMNGAWAEKATNRNFEMDTIDFNRSPIYDQFSSGNLSSAKWVTKTYGSTTQGSAAVSSSQLSLTGVANARYGVLSNNFIQNEYTDYTVKAILDGYTGTNAMISLMGGDCSTFDNNIEFGIDDGYLKIFGDGITSYVGSQISAPIELTIDVSHLKENGRDITFYADGELVYEISDFSCIEDQCKIFLYGWGTSTSIWDAVYIYEGDTFEAFDTQPSSTHFEPEVLGGGTQGTIQYANSKATISGVANERFGLMSEYISNSSVHWTYVEVELDSYTGTNALISLYGDTDSSVYSDFIEFGVENGTLVVYTPSGEGNWQGDSVSFPCSLRIETSPYYANGRNIRFFYNDELVYALWENEELSNEDYKVLLYGYSNSTTVWENVGIYQEHFTDIAGPNFEGSSLPNDWEISSLNDGALGTVDSHDGFCTIEGVSGSRFGVGCMSYENSDIEPFRVVAKLDSYTGLNGLLHITSSEPHGAFEKFIEFGVENGHLKVFTPSGSWEGPEVSCSVRLTVELYPLENGNKNIVFICNNEPVYYLENCSVLEDDEFRLFLYGYGEGTTVWDYADAYSLESWSADGYLASGSYKQDSEGGAVSGRYAQKINIDENASGIMGISHTGIDVISGNEYEVSIWAKTSGSIGNISVILGDNTDLGSNYSSYASATLTATGTTSNGFEKYSVVITPSTTDTDAKLFVGAAGTGTVLFDQVSMMPLDSDEVVYGGWRKDFVDALEELNPNALRWPGGILADWYSWSDGVGSEQDLRPPTYFAQWNACWMTNDVGVDEFLNLCDELSIDPVLNVNYGTGTASYAAEFVEYVNGDVTTTRGAERAQNGHTAPYDITYWEIGNETWGSWTPGYTDAQTFVADYDTFYTAMTVVDPTIQCIAEGGDGNSSDQSWNQTMIDSLATKIDELSIHFYSPQNLPSDYSDDDVYWASVSSPVSIAERLAATQAIIAASEEDIKIAVTEYNAMYFNSLRHRTRSMEGALQVAGLLNEFLRYPGLTDHNDYSCLAQFWDGSAMRFGTRGLIKTPSYYILELYSNKRGEMKVSSSVSCDTYSTTAIGNTPAMQDVPYLDVLVTRSLDGTKLYLSILNRDKDNGCSVPIQINGVSAVDSQASVWTVAADDYLDANSWNDSDVITKEATTISNASTTFSYEVPKLSLTVIELTVSGLSAVQDPVLCGTVIDTNGDPVSGATISTNTGTTDVTDARGYYEMAVSEGNYTVTAERNGSVVGTMNNVYVYSGAGTTVQTMHVAP